MIINGKELELVKRLEELKWEKMETPKEDIEAHNYYTKELKKIIKELKEI